MQESPQILAGGKHTLRSPLGRRATAGSVTLVVMIVTTGAAMVILGVAAASSTHLRHARKGQDALITQTLAEAGVDDAVNALTSDHTAKTATGTLYEDAAQTKKLGSYSVAISDINVALGTKKAVSVATAANGAQKTLVAQITQGTLQLGKAAQMSNGTINLSGGALISTTPLLQHVADVYANGNVTMGGSSMVDGRLISAATVIGTAYFPSVSNAPKYVFPSAIEKTALQTSWQTQSQSTNNTYNANSLFPGNKATVTITAPAYINGDVQLTSGQTLNIQGDGYVYINGNLKLTGNATLKNGSSLVVAGNYSQAGQSLYYVDFSASVTPSLTVITGDIGLQGGSTNVNMGIVYAMNGGISVSGNAIFTGALVAGGVNASISSGGTFVQYFPVGMAAKVSFPSNPTVTHVVEL